jgi:hypothetical protein
MLVVENQLQSSMMYRDLQKDFLPALRRKVITHKLQLYTSPLQTKPVQTGRSYASVTRTDNKQPIACQNNQATYE